MEYKYLLKKLDNRGFQKLICKFEKLDFNIENNVKCFLEKVRVFAFNNKCFFKKLMRVSNSTCKKYKLSDKEIYKIQKGLQPFLNYISSQREKNFNKFNKYIKKDPEFQRKDSLFKEEGGQTKENYDNLIGYFKKKLPWLRKRNGIFSTFMLADDNCVPMYNSDLGDFNNYGNYFSGSIIFPNKECYSNLNYAFKNGYSSENTPKIQVMFEKLGTIFGVVFTKIEVREFRISDNEREYLSELNYEEVEYLNSEGLINNRGRIINRNGGNTISNDEKGYLRELRESANRSAYRLTENFTFLKIFGIIIVLLIVFALYEYYN